MLPLIRAMRAAAARATLLLAVSAPAAAQTAEVIRYQWFGVNISSFPAIYIDWTLGTATGSQLSTPVGISIQVPAGTPVGTTAEVNFRDAATNVVFCRVDVSMPAPQGCTPLASTTPRCTVVSGGMGGGMCQVTVRFEN